MSKSVVIHLGTGDLYHGLPRVAAQLWVNECSRPEQYIGSLPAAPELMELHRNWRSLYHGLCGRYPLRSIAESHQELDGLEIDYSGITHVSQVDFEQLCQSLQKTLNLWLKSTTFLPIERRLRSQLSPAEEVRVVIETDDDLLRRLPWQHWDFFRDYPKAEIALSCLEYQARSADFYVSRNKVRVLAVLGNSQGIDVQEDAKSLRALRDIEIQFLVNPSRQEFNQALWDQKGWDMFFFAGHSHSEGETGRIYINENSQCNSLTIEQFEMAIAGAVSRGLKLAVFNSCDGLGLATALNRLYIPQVIVMREVVANYVAQAFFKGFLEAFAQQQLPLYQAMRQARQQLQGLEDEFPGASWLPVLCQNPAVEPPMWRDWCAKSLNGRRSQPFYRSDVTVLFTSLIVTALILGLRYLGGLQAWELQAFDQLLRLRPPEPPDQRLLIITITEEDLQIPEQRQRQGSLSDLALSKLLTQLLPLKPRAIGLDIYRDFPFNALSARLAEDLNQQSNLFAICKVADPEANFPEIAPWTRLPSDRQGFSDVVVDADAILRRHLLFMDRIPGAACSTPYALSTQLAFYYLKSEGITPRYTQQGHLQLGRKTLPRLSQHRGSYQRADTAGYQILLNYRVSQPSLSPAPTITLSEVLAGRLQPEDVRDRIVLIGVTAMSSKDFLATPYGQRIPGVFLQAQMVSQLVSAVQEGRTLIEVWAWPMEILWVWGWGITGGLLVWHCRSRRWLLGLEGIALSTLGVFCFYGLLQGQWVPLIPTALGFTMTGIGVALVMVNQDKNR